MGIIEAPIRETTKVTTADVLERAADLLEEFDWCQLQLAKDKDGNLCWWNTTDPVAFCVVGATYRATFDLTGGLNDVHEKDALGALLTHLYEAYRWRGTVPQWNDSEGHTKAEVVGALRAAATGLKEAE